MKRRREEREKGAAEEILLARDRISSPYEGERDMRWRWERERERGREGGREGGRERDIEFNCGR